MSTAFNMEKIENLAGTYEEYMGKVNEIMTDVFNGLLEIMNEQKYAPLYEAAAELEDTYNENVLQTLVQYANEWSGGGSSFVEIVKRNKLGDYSEGIAQNAQDRIVTAVQNQLKQSDTLGDKRTLQEAANYDAEILAGKLEEWAGRLQTSIEEAVEDFSARVQTGSEDNEAVAAFVHIDTMIGEGLKEFAKNAIEQLKSKFSEEVKQRMNDTAQQTSDLKGTAAAKAAQLNNEALQKAVSKFTSLFED